MRMRCIKKNGKFSLAEIKITITNIGYEVDFDLGGSNKGFVCRDYAGNLSDTKKVIVFLNELIEETSKLA